MPASPVQYSVPRNLPVHCTWYLGATATTRLQLYGALLPTQHRYYNVRTSRAGWSAEVLISSLALGCRVLMLVLVVLVLLTCWCYLPAGAAHLLGAVTAAATATAGPAATRASLSLFSLSFWRHSYDRRPDCPNLKQTSTPRLSFLHTRSLCLALLSTASTPARALPCCRRAPHRQQPQQLRRQQAVRRNCTRSVLLVLPPPRRPKPFVVRLRSRLSFLSSSLPAVQLVLGCLLLALLALLATRRLLSFITCRRRRRQPVKPVRPSPSTLPTSMLMHSLADTTRLR